MKAPFPFVLATLCGSAALTWIVFSTVAPNVVSNVVLADRAKAHPEAYDGVPPNLSIGSVAAAGENWALHRDASTREGRPSATLSESEKEQIRQCDLAIAKHYQWAAMGIVFLLGNVAAMAVRRLLGD